MDKPRVGLWRSAEHRYWWNGEPEGGLPGVTGVINLATPKEPLMYWSRELVASFAVENFSTLSGLVSTGGHPEAVKWLANEPVRKRDSAAKRGSAVHRLFEIAMRGQAIEPAEDEIAMVEAAHAFIVDYGPRIISMEKSVLNLSAGYGGTFDLIIELGGQVWLVDLKTSKGTYQGTALQLAAYANAEFAALENDSRKYRIPAIARYAVLHLRPEQYERGYSLIEYRVGPAEYAAFLNCLRLAQWIAEARPIDGPVANQWVKNRLRSVSEPKSEAVA